MLKINPLSQINIIIEMLHFGMFHFIILYIIDECERKFRVQINTRILNVSRDSCRAL